jgi:predicted esterase
MLAGVSLAPPDASDGFPPSAATWKIPVSDVHGRSDPLNAISLTYADRDAFVAAGHVFTLHEFAGGPTISPRAGADAVRRSEGLDLAVEF